MESLSEALPSLLGSALVGAAVATTAYSARGSLAQGLDFVERDLIDKLRRLRAPTNKVHRYVVLWLVAIGVVFIGFWLFLDSPIFAITFAALLFCGPWYLLRRMAQQRRLKIEDQLADAMVMLANAIRAGLSLAQSIDILASQCPKPISTEFRQIVNEYNLGKPLEQTLQEAKLRLGSENFALFAAALLASHESGGRLNEVVERIAQSVLELQRLERKLLSETAQARKSAVYMSIAPAFILVVYYFVEPLNTELLFTKPVGQMVLATALALNIAAYLWARKILSPDI